MTMLIGPPPGPRGHRLMGNLAQYRRDPLGFLTDCACRYGDVVPLRFGPVRATMLNHPDLIEEVLVTKHRHFVKHGALRFARLILGNGLLTSEGDAWRRQRRLVQPAFHRERIAGYAAVTVAIAERMLDGWRGGQVRDAHDDMMRLSLEVVASCLFGADLSGDAAEAGAALDRLQRHFNTRVSRVFAVPWFVPTPGHVRLWKAWLRLDRIVSRMIEGRRAAGGDRGDLLSMFLHAIDEDGGGFMTDRQVRDEAMTLLLAGHETTANTLAWAWFLLAKNPEPEARLHEELDRVLDGRPPTFDDLPRLRYADAVIAEALRVFPTAYAIGRQAVEPCTIGGHKLPRGMTVLMCQWVLHRDPRFFDAPEDFRPERWTDGLARRLPRFAYFPFGGGPRICIGNSFAQMEATLILGTVARRFRLAVRPDLVVRPLPSMTLRPDGGLEVVLSERGEVSGRRRSAAPPTERTGTDHGEPTSPLALAEKLGGKST